MNIHLAILYVANPAASARFYEHLLGTAPLDESPNFVMFKTQGANLGLWARHDIDLAPTATAGSSELDWIVGSIDEVHKVHADWIGKGVTILQAPVQKEFGFTLVGSDPDGHRLRVLFPNG